jgi:hypothetical protein
VISEAARAGMAQSPPQSPPLPAAANPAPAAILSAGAAIGPEIVELGGHFLISLLDAGGLLPASMHRTAWFRMIMPTRHRRRDQATFKQKPRQA